MVNVETTPSVYVKLENRPGTLERATKTIGAKGINIDALALETNGNVGFLRFLTPRVREAVDALKAQGIEAYESQVVLVNAPNKPGELSRLAAEVAAANINVEGILTTTDGRIAMRTSDNERAAQILRKH